MTATEENIIKLIVVGEASVGKTSILNQWIHRTFLSITAPTIGAGMMPVQMCVDGANYLVHVWDTAGTPQYQSVVPMFCRDTNIALLVFDVTKKSTFDKILSWYDFVRGNSYPYFILIGNKIDLEEREVSKQAAIELAEELKADYYETSSATREGIEDMKKGICQAIVTVNSTCIVSKPTSRIKTQTLQNESKCC